MGCGSFFFSSCGFRVIVLYVRRVVSGPRVMAAVSPVMKAHPMPFRSVASFIQAMLAVVSPVRVNDAIVVMHPRPIEISKFSFGVVMVCLVCGFLVVFL